MRARAHGLRLRRAEAHGLRLGRAQPAESVGEDRAICDRRAYRRGNEFAELPGAAEAGRVYVELAPEAEVGADDLALGLHELDRLVGMHERRRDEVGGDDGCGAGDAHRAVDLGACGVSIVVTQGD